MIPDTVYAPEEDSFLLASCIEKHPKVSSVLDVGCGSGVLSAVAKKTFPDAKVVGIDMNREAVLYSTATHQDCLFIQSDLFENVHTKFELIVCNPPYLPANRLDEDDMLNNALVGGKKGYEYIARFLSEVKDYLTENGTILLLFSNLSNKDMVHKYIEENLFSYKEIAKQNVGLMEDLYVYELQRFSEVAQLEKQGVSNIAYFKKGKRGYILKGILEGKKVVCKIAKHTEPLVIEKEGLFLEKVNALHIGPELFLKTKDVVVMEYIEGTILKEFVQAASESMLRQVFSLILDQLFILDQKGLQKFEMVNPYKHIIITKEQKSVLIDFERMIHSENPKNVRQFVEYIRKKSSFCKNEEKMRIALKAYKEDPSKENFEKICNLL